MPLNETEMGKKDDLWSFRSNISEIVGDIAQLIIGNRLPAVECRLITGERFDDLDSSTENRNITVTK